MSQAALRTAREIVSQRFLVGTKRRRRIPLQQYPRPIERDYERTLTSAIAEARAAYAPVLDALAELLRGAAADQTRQDAGEAARARDLVERASANFEAALEQRDIASAAAQVAARTSVHNRAQLGRQMRAAFGVDVAHRDQALAGIVEGFVQHNVALIKRIPARLHGEVEGMVLQALTSGQLTAAGGVGALRDGLTRDIAARFDVHERHARVIARDQIGKLYAQINEARQRDLGVTRYRWRSSRDGRVRPSHVEYDKRSQRGETFSYDKPPRGGNPGHDVQCRCHGEPVLEDILDALEKQ